MAREVWREFSAEYPPDRGEINLRRLQAAFAELMDLAAIAALRSGYDLDDYELERLAAMRYAGDERTLTVPVESLTDPQRLLNPFLGAARASFGEPLPEGCVEIARLIVQLVIDPAAPGSPRIPV
ncbi:MAG: hypothetical protein ACYSUI_08305 [Planctomycetota bacterium]|jgi:N-methylhydantoinase A/oxoprolinase/acetone carboxylase beta subunit